MSLKLPRKSLVLSAEQESSPQAHCAHPLSLPRKWSADCAQGKSPASTSPLTDREGPTEATSPERRRVLRFQKVAATEVPAAQAHATADEVAVGAWWVSDDMRAKMVRAEVKASTRAALPSAAEVRKFGGPSYEPAREHARREAAVVAIQCAYWSWHARREAAAVTIQCAWVLARSRGSDAPYWAWYARHRGSDAPEPPPGALDGWEEVTADDGRVYYWNVATDQTSWTVPTPHSTDGASAFAERDAAAAVRQCAATALPELSLDELFARAYAPQQAHEPPPLAPLPDRRTLLYIRTREKQAELNALASTRGVSSFDSSKIEAVLMGGPRNGLAPSSQLPPAERFSASKRWELSARRNVRDRLKSSAFRSKLEASLLRRVSAAGSTEDEDESTSERSSSGAGSVATSPLGLPRPDLVRALRPSTSVVSMARVAFEGSCALR